MASIARPKRPGSVVVLGVLQLIVGVIGLVYEGLIGALMLAAMNSPKVLTPLTDRDPTFGFCAEAPYFLQALLAVSAAGVVLSIIQIADGIGLLMVRRWAYNLGVLYGWLSIINQVVWLAFLFLIVAPVAVPATENMVVPVGTANPPQYRAAAKAKMLAEDGSEALGLIYPIFVLIMLATTRKAFRRPKAATEDVVQAADAQAQVIRGDAPVGREPDDRVGPPST